MMRLTGLLVAVGIVAGLTSAVPVVAGASKAPTAKRVSSARGTAALTLKVSAPRRAPRLALVPVSVTLRNPTNHPVWVWVKGPVQFGYMFPQVEVLGPSGRVVYPPALRGYPALTGPAPALKELWPRHTLKKTEDVVLKGDRVRAVVDWSSTGRHSSSPYDSSVKAVRSNIVRVRLVPEDPPRVTLDTSGNSWSAEVVPPAAVGNRFLVMDWADCSLPAAEEERIYWAPIRTPIVPPCSDPKSWHGLVGQLGHSVAFIDAPG